ncbi:MAG: hypothetical protein WCY34_02105 [Candidatus Omnitrophota bacterium]|jgi:hypothetical protein
MRIVFFLVLILYFVFSLPSYAAPCYGTRMPQGRGFQAGIQNYTIVKRGLKEGFGKLRSVQDFLQLSYGVFDWLSIDLKGGAGNIRQHPDGSDEIDYPTSFAGGYGLRFRLYNSQRIKMVFGFQHISVHPRSVNLEGVKNKAVLDDWQVSLLGSYDFSILTPYLGVRWSRVDYIHWVEEDRKREMSDPGKGFGLVCGLDVPLTKAAWVNLEGQFIDGKAFAASLNFSF